MMILFVNTTSAIYLKIKFLPQLIAKVKKNQNSRQIVWLIVTVDEFHINPLS